MSETKTIVLPYNPVLYNGLPGPKTAHKQFHLINVDQFYHDSCVLVTKHGLNDSVCGFLMHAHFQDDMAEDEVLLEQVNEEEAVTTPVKVASAPDMIPHMFKVILREGRACIQPLEFSVKTPVNAAHLQRLLSDEGQAFLTSYYDLCVQYGVQDNVGLHIRTRDSLVTNDKPILLEKSTVDRVSTVYPTTMAEADDEVPVVFYFDPINAEDANEAGVKMCTGCPPRWTACCKRYWAHH